MAENKSFFKEYGPPVTKWGGLTIGLLGLANFNIPAMLVGGVSFEVGRRWGNKGK